MGLKGQIIKIATQVAQNQIQNFQATAQIQQSGAQTQYLGQIQQWDGTNYTVSFPDGSITLCPPGGYSAPSIGDTVVVVQGVIVA